MLHEAPRAGELGALGVDLTVIGGGPVGLISALAARERGMRVLLLETGGVGADPARQSQSDETILTPSTHHEGRLTTSRRLGGAGHLWGGRCVPFDPIDFEGRPWLPGCAEGWPIGPEALDPYLERALGYLGAGPPVFESRPPGGLAARVSAPGPGGAPSAFAMDRLERWTADPRIERRHMKRLREDADLHVALGCTCTGARLAPGAGGHRLSELSIWTEADGAVAALPARRVLLAAGGLASTRLLLAIREGAPGVMGGPEGPLGRFYMGHVNGQIADIVIDDADADAAFDFHQDAHGYVRRRIVPTDASQRELELSNVAFWPVVPEIAEAQHRSGALSAVFLGLTAPGIGHRFVAEAIRLKHVGPGPHRRAPHLRNLLADLPGTLAFVPRFMWRRYVSEARVPGFFLRNPGRRYGLEFHAEHLPHEDSRVTLDPDRRDRTGLPHACVDFRFDAADAAPILRAHEALDGWLRERGLGRLAYRYDEHETARGIFAEAKHGNHQIGTIRMGRDPRDGVVDGLGQVFGIENLSVASTAILPTSSQANPTLVAVQLALRTVDHLAREDAGGA